MILSAQHSRNDGDFRAGRYEMRHQLRRQHPIHLRLDRYDRRPATQRSIGRHTDYADVPFLLGAIDDWGERSRLTWRDDQGLDPAVQKGAYVLGLIGSKTLHRSIEDLQSEVPEAMSFRPYAFPQVIVEVLDLPRNTDSDLEIRTPD